MLMGLTNVPAMFIQTMKNLFMDLLDNEVVVILDDILIYSIIVEKHFKLLEKIFACLHKYKFYCKLKKCSFLQRSTTFLGFATTPERLPISNATVQSLKE